MLDTLLSGPFVPFSLSLALLFGLLALELAFLAVGASLIGDGPSGDVGADLAGADGIDLGAELGDFDVDPGDFDLAIDEINLTGEPPASGAMPPGLSWLGLGKMPTLIWLACLLMAFGVSGMALQSLATAITGQPLAALVAAIPCGAAALWVTGRFGALFARLLPRNDSQSVPTRSLGRRPGVVTQGTARRDMPAEVRVTDRYGNTHYLRAEPLRDGEEIAQGTTVLVLRHRPSGGFRLIAL